MCGALAWSYREIFFQEERLPWAGGGFVGLWRVGLRLSGDIFSGGTFAVGLEAFEWCVACRLGAVWEYFFLGNVCRRVGGGLNGGRCVGLGLCGGAFFWGTFAVGWRAFERWVVCGPRAIGRYFFRGHVCHGLRGVRKVGGALAWGCVRVLFSGERLP